MRALVIHPSGYRYLLVIGGNTGLPISDTISAATRSNEPRPVRYIFSPYYLFFDSPPPSSLSSSPIHFLLFFFPPNPSRLFLYPFFFPPTPLFFSAVRSLFSSFHSPLFFYPYSVFSYLFPLLSYPFPSSAIHIRTRSVASRPPTNLLAHLPTPEMLRCLLPRPLQTKQIMQ